MPFSGRSERPGIGRRARLGPTRSCISALHLRSAIVSSVAVTMMSTRMSATMVPMPSPRLLPALGAAPKSEKSHITKLFTAQTSTYKNADTPSSTAANAPQPAMLVRSHLP